MCSTTLKNHLYEVICSQMIAYLIITQLTKQGTQTQLHSCDAALRISPIYSVRRHRASSELIKTRKKKREKGRERKIKIAHRHPHKYRNRIILMSFTPLTMHLWIFSPLPFHLTPNTSFFPLLSFLLPSFLLQSLPLLPPATSVISSPTSSISQSFFRPLVSPGCSLVVMETGG